MTGLQDGQDFLNPFRSEKSTLFVIPSTLTPAGIKAKHSSSYALGFTYLSNAAALVSPDYRAQNEGAFFDMMLECLECAYLSGQNEQGRLISKSLRASASNTLDQARILQVEAMSQLHLSNNAETFRICWWKRHKAGWSKPLAPPNSKTCAPISAPW